MTRFSGHRRRLLGALAVTAFVATGIGGTTSAHSQAASWPTRSVRILVPFSVGGTTDLVARLIGKALQDATGQTFVIENKTGASGTIASGEVSRATPDGYTLLLTTGSTHAISPHVNKIPYDVVKDFTPIIQLAESDILILGTPKLGVKNIPELIALARSKPGALKYTTSGVGTLTHLAFEQFATDAGITLTHVPYKGSGSAIADLTAGVVDLTMDSIPTGQPHVEGGRALGLATTGPKRSIPNIASVGETLPGYNVLTWSAIYGPKDMPADLVQRINAAFAKALQSPEIVERYKFFGLALPPSSPAAFAAMAAKDLERWGKVAKSLGITAQ